MSCCDWFYGDPIHAPNCPTGLGKDDSTKEIDQYFDTEDRRIIFLEEVQAEVECAYKKHGNAQWGRHEFYGILWEEMDELWDSIKDDEPMERVYEELIQVAAVCMRYYETRDRYREPND